MLLSAIGGQADGVDSVPLNRSIRINVLKKDVSSVYYWVGMIFVLIVTVLCVKEPEI